MTFRNVAGEPDGAILVILERVKTDKGNDWRYPRLSP